jgi:uncharacterized protein (TIGR02646 family)
VTLFQYPKDIHTRKLAPRQFKRYQSYKRYLQHEFVRVCVYCRQPDSSAPNLTFGVDHYKPKGIPRFASLVCTYQNLYYCCGSCNSRKNNDWPADEIAGPYVVNPCDYGMASHLRFDRKTGKVESRTPHGQHTLELLQLNDIAVVEWRRGTLKMLEVLLQEIEELERQLQDLDGLLRKAVITKVQYDADTFSSKQDIADLREMAAGLTGERPLPALKKKRGNVSLLP